MLKNRIELAKYFGKLGFKKGAEIGTCYGYFSQVLCQNIPGLKLFTVDNWNNPWNSARERRMKINCEAEARKTLAPYNAVIIKKDSTEAANDIPNESLDFVFIDADHRYKPVINDLNAWVPKVRSGGIVSGHDYYVFPSGNRGVIDAVNEFVDKHKYKLSIIGWDRRNKNPDNRLPCWYFVKT